MGRAFQSLAGRLLVSHPLQRDANFDRSVVLLHSHDRDGALGVILNRPLGQALGQAQAAFASSPLSDVPLHFGGPVATDRMAFGGWSFPSGASSVLRYGVHREEAPQLARDPTFRLFAYVGYSGWGGGQLEEELRLGAWVTCDFEARFMAHEGEQLWRALLVHHRPDQRLAMDSPDDPGLN